MVLGVACHLTTFVSSHEHLEDIVHIVHFRLQVKLGACADCIALCLLAGILGSASAQQIDTIVISASPSSAASTPAATTFTFNCPADGFNNQFFIYFGDSCGGPVAQSGPQLVSPRTNCAGISTVTHTYQQVGVYQVSPLGAPIDKMRPDIDAMLEHGA